jgi:hypothetical protein
VKSQSTLSDFLKLILFIAAMLGGMAMLASTGYNFR